MFRRFKRHLHWQLDTILIVCLSLASLSADLVSSGGHEFCGLSELAGAREFSVRTKRAAASKTLGDNIGRVSLDYRRQRAGANGMDWRVQEPEQRREDQVVIDSPNLSGAQLETKVECVAPVPASRPNGSGSSSSSSKQMSDCAANNNTGNTGGQTGDARKTIETAVFIDQALDNKFDGKSGGLVDLNKLVMTIMNQVQSLFSYSSLKVPIRIKIVLIEHLKDSERFSGKMPDPVGGDIDAYLSNFCNWQQTRLEREKRLWWDHAILLSGLDLYKATPTKNHTGVLGLAWVGGMCKGNYSCTVNEASNFESAFVIAHEIGHSLGIMHDGQRNTCDPNGFIMSERTGAGKVHWSRCSNSYLNESISRRQLSCLDSEQSGASESLYELAKLRAPGQVYTINDQCRLAFGSNYTSFVTRQQPFNAVCRELWCVAGTWAKAAHPALEGSACDQDKLCREGKCAR